MHVPVLKKIKGYCILVRYTLYITLVIKSSQVLSRFSITLLLKSFNFSPITIARILLKFPHLFGCVELAKETYSKFLRKNSKGENGSMEVK